jgi:hypothetical protein
MIWKTDQGSRGYHHGNLKEALIRAALELLEYVVTAEDPTVWTRPWTAKQEFWSKGIESDYAVVAS